MSFEVLAENTLTLPAPRIRKSRSIAAIAHTLSLQVEFTEIHSLSELISALQTIHSPQIILWYIGINGLRKEGMDFYRDSLIHPILQKNHSAKFWLVDLTAWGAFKHPTRSPNQCSSLCQTLEQLSSNQIKCIKSSDIFTKMKNITDKKTLTYFKKALKRKFISKKSKHFHNLGTSIRDIFGDCPIAEDFYDQDVNKAYSTFQYLEGCLLIDEIVTQLASQNHSKAYELIFALPNDELKYYKDRWNSFQKDAAFLLKTRCASFGLNIEHVNIKFMGFEYGLSMTSRPYNLPGKSVNTNQLILRDIIGYV